MRRFAADRVAGIMERVGMDEETPLESGIVSRFIESAQTRVEGYNFDIRKNVVEYDDVIAKQREVIYADRRRYSNMATCTSAFISMIRNEIGQSSLIGLPRARSATKEERLDDDCSNR